MNFQLPSQKNYTVYSKSGCPNCDRIKLLLEFETVIYINCDEYLKENRDDFIEDISQLANKQIKSFPIVFHNAKYMGNYFNVSTDTYMKYKNI